MFLILISPEVNFIIDIKPFKRKLAKRNVKKDFYLYILRHNLPNLNQRINCPKRTPLRQRNASYEFQMLR